MTNQNICQEVTNKIVVLLEQGVTPWACPWKPSSQSSHFLPFNASSNKAYSGINVLMLWMTRLEKHYTSNAWITFKQAQKLKARVMKDAQGSKCFFYDIFEKEESDGSVLQIPYLKTYIVFNLDQINGGKFSFPEIPSFDLVQKAEDVIKATNADIRYGKRAFYQPIKDYIEIPAKGAFTNNEDYYATVFHELAHWTGHKTRLNFPHKAQRFGDECYAFEELVAELGSAFVCADLGISSTYQHHASYIDSWLKILKKDPKAIFTASALASKVHFYIMSKLDVEVLNCLQETESPSVLLANNILSDNVPSLYKNIVV